MRHPVVDKGRNKDLCEPIVPGEFPPPEAIHSPTTFIGSLGGGGATVVSPSQLIKYKVNIVSMRKNYQKKGG